jgi:hypothetical protein
VLNPFDPGFSPLAMLAMQIHPEPAEFPERPPSAADGEALLARLAAAPDEMRAAADGTDDASAAAVLRSALFWESWLDHALGQFAAGGRLKVGGNVIVHLPDDPSPAGVAAQFARSRGEHVAELRRRGVALWSERASGMDGAPIPAYPLLSAVAANDVRRLELLREGS